MLYALLIHEAAGLDDARSPEERERVLAAHRHLQEDTKEAGAFVAATQLAEAGAVTVRRRKDEVLVTDGPFAETKELFIGLYLFDCASLQEALDRAARIPVSEMGRVEVRPVAYNETRAYLSE